MNNSIRMLCLLSYHVADFSFANICLFSMKKDSINYLILFSKGSPIAPTFW